MNVKLMQSAEKNWWFIDEVAFFLFPIYFKITFAGFFMKYQQYLRQTDVDMFIKFEGYITEFVHSDLYMNENFSWL